MNDLRPPTGYIVGTAFLFGVGFAALVILGLGAIAVMGDTDSPVSPVLDGLAPIPLVISGLVCVAALVRHGLKRDNRLRWMPVLSTSVVTVLGYAISVALVILVFQRWEPATSWLHIGQAVVAPATVVVFVAAATSAWAYFGTLRWQARNAETKQFAHPED